MTAYTPTSRHRRRGTGNAFTLVELMISIAMAVLLILGVNQIFRITSDTINATTALGGAVRQSRSTQGTLIADFKGGMAFDAPFITLDSNALYAFRNRADMDADRNGQPANWDVNENGNETDSVDTVPTTTYNFRNHRVDILNFFANSFFRRQTGNDGIFASDLASNEVWISYGHLRLYDNVGNPNVAGSYRDLGVLGGNATTNPNNYFASNWALGRSSILLRPEDASRNIYHDRVLQNFVRRANLTDATDLAPLSAGSQSTTYHGTPSFLIQSSRYDLAGATISDYRSRLRNYINHTRWRGSPTRLPALVTPEYPEDWWTRMSYRFWANPFPAKPFDSRRMAQAAPIFVTGCSQFMVEFAGDFLHQNSTGAAVANNPPNGEMHVGDGVIDFILDGGVRRTRWYGSPRDVAGPGHTQPDGFINPAHDVVPVSQVRMTNNQPARPWTSTARPTFEKSVVANSNVQPSLTNPRYVCAWGPYEMAKSSTERPLMFRITMTVEDANNRLSEGQTYEYVFKLGL